MKQALALFLAVTIAALSGCGGSGSSAAPASAVAPAVPSSAVSAVSEAVSNAASPSATRTFTDSAGRTVEIPAAPSRIAPSGPLAQIALAPDQLVCLSTKWDKRSTEYIGAAYLQLPVVGQLYGTKGTLNLEGLAAVEPQLVIDIGEAKKTVAEDMDALQKQVGV
ncbi:MAG: ABC transporter substrate-binding protein, partial [Oscillospiraceae bacterium]